jgi:hypothetical protein
VAPLAKPVVNEKVPLALTTNVSVPLFNVKEEPAVMPDTVPPVAKTVMQLTWTDVTAAEPIVPDPLVTEHDCPVGCDSTVTA